MSWRRMSAWMVLIAVTGHTGLSAQEERARLIQEARAEFDETAAVALLIRAADPVSAPLDSLWAVSVHDLALNLMGLEREALSAVWLRWAARHGSEWPVDRDDAWYPEQLVDAWDAAVAAVGPSTGPTDAALRTTWIWPERLDPEARGTLRVDPDATTTGATVTVNGDRVLEPGEEVSLEPGTYDLLASGPGEDTVRVAREVLPGVTTVLAPTSAPTLASDVEERVRDALVQVRFEREGLPVCTNGVVVRPGGFVLTSYSGIEGRSTATVSTAAGGVEDASVAGTDRDLGLAVLRIEARGSNLLDPGQGAPGTRTWAVHRDGCDTSATAATAATALDTWPPGGAAALSPPLPSAALGAPLVDQAGNLLGVIAAPNRVVPLAEADALLQRVAAERVAATGMEEAQVGEGGGGFPLVWVGAGVAAAGVAALLLGGGGSGEAHDENGNGSQTGIRIIFQPGGTP